MCLVLILPKLFHCFKKNCRKFTKEFCFSCNQKLSCSKILNDTSVTVEEERLSRAISLMACILASFARSVMPNDSNGNPLPKTSQLWE